MLLTNRRMVSDTNRLSELSKKALPVKVSYAIAKNIGKVEAELISYNAERKKLIDQYAIKENNEVVVGENGQIGISKESIEAWNKDINDLLDIEVEVVIHKFSVESFGDISMTISELMLIDYMVED